MAPSFSIFCPANRRKPFTAYERVKCRKLRRSLQIPKPLSLELPLPNFSHFFPSLTRFDFRIMEYASRARCPSPSPSGGGGGGRESTGQKELQALFPARARVVSFQFISSEIFEALPNGPASELYLGLYIC